MYDFCLQSYEKNSFYLPVSQKNRNFALVIELQRHIEILLLSNDCVIIPDFGGFVAHNVSARYDEHDHTLLPPMRMLGFNPQLRMNDSLLVQSYITAYDISYPEALRRIEGEVDEMKDALDVEGYYTLDSIGTLSVNSDGNIQFEPCEAGVLSPEYYALGACEFYLLKDKVGLPVPVEEPTLATEVALPTEPALLDFTDNEEDEERAVKIKLSWIRNTVAIAAAVVAFFIMVTPISNSNLQTQTMSQLQSKLFYKLMPQDSNMAPATPVPDLSQKTQDDQNTPSTQNTQNTQKAQSTQNIPTTQAAAPHPYCIVLASQVKQSNAEYYVEQLKKQGYEEASVYIHNKVVRVIYGAYATEAEAYQQLNKMNSKEEFSEAWVYKLKEV